MFKLYKRTPIYWFPLKCTTQSSFQVDCPIFEASTSYCAHKVGTKSWQEFFVSHRTVGSTYLHLAWVGAVFQKPSEDRVACQPSCTKVEKMFLTPFTVGIFGHLISSLEEASEVNGSVIVVGLKDHHVPGIQCISNEKEKTRFSLSLFSASLAGTLVPFLEQCASQSILLAWPLQSPRQSVPNLQWQT